MESVTGISQLFMNLCHSSAWNFAILWKLQETSLMLFACEDAYVRAKKSHVTMEYAPCTGFVSSDPEVSTFGCEMNAETGHIPSCSIEVVISNISRYCYFLGEGIVGQAASAEKHKWICLWGLNSRLLLEYPEELQLQVAAGIKTVLLVPVPPLGVVQLGSVDELSEDLKMVAEIKDLFFTYQCTLDLQSTSNLKTYNGTMFSRPMIQKYSACLATATELTDPSSFQPKAMQDWTSLDYAEVIEDEILLTGSDKLPQLMVEPYEPVAQDGFFGVTNSSDELIWDAMCSELLPDYSVEQVVINSSTNTGSTMIGDESIICYLGEVDMIPDISDCLAPEDPIMSDICLEDLQQYTYDLYQNEETYLGFGEEFDVVMNSIIESRFLDNPIDFDIEETIQSRSWMEFDESAWTARQSEANELGNSMSILEVPESVRPSVEEPVTIIKYNDSTDYLPDALIAELLSLSDENAVESSGCLLSCITRYEVGDLLGSEDSILWNHGMPLLISNTEGLTSHPMTGQNNSVIIPSSNEDQQDMERGTRKRCFNSSQRSNKQAKKRERHRPRPRDRQLIQHRIAELRELIPNGSKCSIDELLERAVTHMMFLKSVPVHAENLNKSRRAKVGGKDLKILEQPVTQNEASLVCELETNRNNLPLIIEDLEKPNQMLVEMQCRDYGLFFDIAQAFKRLKLTILEGTLESRSREHWAHFIVEVPKGFNRMDMLWPLMSLLQYKFR